MASKPGTQCRSGDECIPSETPKGSHLRVWQRARQPVVSGCRAWRRDGKLGSSREGGARVRGEGIRRTTIRARDIWRDVQNLHAKALSRFKCAKIATRLRGAFSAPPGTEPQEKMLPASAKDRATMDGGLCIMPHQRASIRAMKNGVILASRRAKTERLNFLARVNVATCAV